MTGDDWEALADLAWCAHERAWWQAMYSRPESVARRAAVAALKVAATYDERAAAARVAG